LIGLELISCSEKIIDETDYSNRQIIYPSNSDEYEGNTQLKPMKLDGRFKYDSLIILLNTINII